MAPTVIPMTIGSSQGCCAPTLILGMSAGTERMLFELPDIFFVGTKNFVLEL
jgi:hypothetical protein